MGAKEKHASGFSGAAPISQGRDTIMTSAPLCFPSSSRHSREAASERTTVCDVLIQLWNSRNASQDIPLAGSQLNGSFRNFYPAQTD
jgi:hypothetical protein